MKKNSLWITALLLGAFCFAQNSFAATVVYHDNSLKIKSLSVTANGVEFSLKTKKNVILSTNSTCANEFIVPRGHADYEMFAAFLLTAQANRKKIGISFDDDLTDCMVPVDSVTIF